MNYNFELKNFTDERSYHNTLIFIYLKAAKDVLGDHTKVRIGNSLNQGYFTYADTDGSLSLSDVRKIAARMQNLIDQDIELKEIVMTNAEAAEMWDRYNCREKARLLRGRDPEEEIAICGLGRYKNFMYCKLLPSTGYVDRFELRPYRQGMLLRAPTCLTDGRIPAYRDDDKLYDAFAETRRVRKATGINYLADMNDAIRDGRTDELIMMSEALQSKQINEFADMIIQAGKKMVLIAGPSSSGKTTSAKRLCQAIAAKTGEDPLYLGTDDYFVEREFTPVGPDGAPDFEGLGALDLDLFNEQMSDLLAGREVDLPEFDFLTGKKKYGGRITTLRPGQILVIEGIHSLNDVLTSTIPAGHKFKIYISPLTQLALDCHNRISTADARLLRRMVRDNQFRGYDAEHTLESWPKVRAGESVNIFPYSSSADIVFNSSTVYETNLLRTYAEPLLLEIGEDNPMYAEAQRILTFMKYFDKIESADAVPQNSILREFIGH